MATEDKKGKETSTINDVSKPGKTPASATSRPIIVKNREIMRDPMVAASNPTQIEADESADKKSASEAADGKSKTSSTETVNRKAPKVEAPKSTEEEKPDDKTKDKSESEKEPSSNGEVGSAAVDALANEAVKKSEKAKEDIEKEELIKRHIEEKTYFAPTGQISKRRARVRGIVLFVVLLILAGAYLAIDAGLILEGVSLPFEIIK